MLNDRRAAVISAGDPARNRIVKVGHRDRSQRNLSFCQPVDEFVSDSAVDTNRSFRKPTRMAQPSRVGQDFDRLGMTFLLCFLQPAHKAEESNGTTQEQPNDLP